MSPIEIIEHILREKGMKPSDFAASIEKPASSIARILNGETARITRSMAININDHYPEYSINWLKGAEIENAKNAKRDKNVDSQNKELALIAAENWKDLMSFDFFRGQVDREVMKMLLKFKEHPKEYEKWLENL